MGFVKRKTLKKAGGLTSGVPTCPKCGGTAFEACRSNAQKVDAVLFLPALLFQKKQDIRCVICGARFRRG